MKIIAYSFLPVLLTVVAAQAADAASVTLQVDPSTTIPANLMAGNTFTLSLELNNQSQTGVAGYDVDVESLVYSSASSSFVPDSNDLALTNVTLTSPELNFPNAVDPTPATPAVLDPQAGTTAQPIDLGASNLFTNETVGNGVSPLETLTFQVQANANPGTYELEFYSIQGNQQGAVTIADENGDSIGTATTPFASDAFTIAAAPEPPTALLLVVAAALSAGALSLRRRLAS